MEHFFRVYKAGMDCAVPFPRLFRDLPKSKDVVNTRSPFEEGNSLFANGVFQGEDYAMLHDLTEYFACLM